MAHMPDIYDQAADLLKWLSYRVQNAFTVEGMGSKQWLRLLITVCAYFIFRPYLIKLGIYIQGKEIERTLGKKEDREDAVQKMRGGKADENISDETTTTRSTTGVEGRDTAAGKKFRKRQRTAAQNGLDQVAERETTLLENWDEDEEFLDYFNQKSPLE